MNTSLFKPYSPTGVYGMFGYAGHCCDSAIKRDDPKMAKECWERGWLDAGTKMLIGTVGEHCQRHAPKCAAMLEKLGPTKVEPENIG